MLSTLVGTWVSENLGATAMFAMFGGITFIGTVYIHIFVKDTTYIVEEGKEKRHMTLEEKKNIYTPKD